jgi:hypothetical protein
MDFIRRRSLSSHTDAPYALEVPDRTEEGVVGDTMFAFLFGRMLVFSGFCLEFAKLFCWFLFSPLLVCGSYLCSRLGKLLFARFHAVFLLFSSDCIELGWCAREY